VRHPVSHQLTKLPHLFQGDNRTPQVRHCRSRTSIRSHPGILPGPVTGWPPARQRAKASPVPGCRDTAVLSLSELDIDPQPPRTLARAGSRVTTGTPACQGLPGARIPGHRSPVIVRAGHYPMTTSALARTVAGGRRRFLTYPLPQAATGPPLSMRDINT